jgi:hypothetical protein
MKAKVTLGIGILVLVAIFATAFAFMNYNQVQVWPLGGRYPLTVVIIVSLGLGLTAGVLGTFLAGYLKTRRGAPLVELADGGERERPGRP